MLIGTLLLVPGFLLYMGVLWSLNKAAPEVPGAKSAKAPAPARTPRPA